MRTRNVERRREIRDQLHRNTQERFEDDKAKRAKSAEECVDFRRRMRPLLDAYSSSLLDSTDLGELKVWASGALAYIESTSDMKLLWSSWSDLRLAFGHDSRTITKRVIGSDFEQRLLKALEEHAALEKARDTLIPVQVRIVQKGQLDA